MEKKISKIIGVKVFCSCHSHNEPFRDSAVDGSKLFWLDLEPSDVDARLKEIACFIWEHFRESTEFALVTTKKSFSAEL